MVRRSAALLASTALAVGGAALLVPSPATAASAADKVVASVGDQVERKGHGALLTPADRRELRKDGHLTITRTTKKKGEVTVLVQLGQITAISPTSVSLRSRDGYTHSYALTSRTKVRAKGAATSLSGVKVGVKALVVAVHTDKGDNARRLALRQVAAAG